jgi:hypothetical protein
MADKIILDLPFTGLSFIKTDRSMRAGDSAQLGRPADAYAATTPLNARNREGDYIEHRTRFVFLIPFELEGCSEGCAKFC